MSRKVAVIHTSFVSVNDLKALFSEIVPSVKMYNIVDDSLLAEVLENGRLTNNVIRRLCNYAIEAESIGIDLIFNQCSSVGEAVDVARKIVNTPILKVDEPMAEEAVKIGGRISVVATVPTTLAPSVRLIENTAEAMGKSLQIRKCLVEGAFDALTKGGDREKHNQMVLEFVEREAAVSDAVVLAQGSMICLLPMLGHIRVPVLSSPRSGVLRVKQALGL